jgi:malonyl-CoA O-methyltransferase
MNDPTKNRIKTCFNKAWRSYDNYASVQKMVCEKSIEMVNQLNREFTEVADFACGTGISTQYLINNIRHKKIYAIDFSEKLIDVARKKPGCGSAEYILADFDSLLFPQNTVDMIFCNMGLQWSLNLKNTLTLFNSYIKESGIIIFSIPLQGTFIEMRKSSKNKLHCADDIGKMIEQMPLSLLECHHANYVEKFSTQIEALRSIKSVGANCLIFKDKTCRLSSLSKRNTELFVSKEDVSLTYHIGIFMAKKTKEEK